MIDSKPRETCPERVIGQDGGALVRALMDLRQTYRIEGAPDVVGSLRDAIDSQRIRNAEPVPIVGEWLRADPVWGSDLYEVETVAPRFRVPG